MSGVPNPFESARRRAALSVMLQAADLIDAWPSLTAAQAQRILDNNGSAIAVRMLAAGIETAIAIVKQEGALS